MNPLLRIIDANANRAREGLRVLEDIARFGLDDAGLARRLKEARHGLREALSRAGIEHSALLASRDTPGDIGTAISTPSEGSRRGMRDIASAAAARLTEALRSIEEAMKPFAAGSAVEIERCRYLAYAIEKDLLLALPTEGAHQWRLCVLITEALCRHHAWERVAAMAIEGGAEALQLREKSLSDRELLDRARHLVQIAHGRADIIINDRPDVALLAGAKGVHLGKDDLSISEARSLIGHQLLIGRTTSTLDEALEAVRAGADYLGCGPMFASSTKPKPHLAGPGFIREVSMHPVCSAIPHLAISGITPGNLGELIAAGCRGVAVSGFVCSAEDPAEACRALRREFVNHEQR